ncbi:MAG: hypothetical protein AB8I08_22680 [Sandaracinaceae bacterium]
MPRLPDLRACAPLLVCLLVGCSHIASPEGLPRMRADYGESLTRSSNEQLLLNLVRLRHLHVPQFLEVTAIATQSSVRHQSGAGVRGNLGRSLTEGGRPEFASPSLGGDVRITERPTVSYGPLSGEAFSRRLARPLQLGPMYALVNAGWRIDRLMACCVARINDLGAPPIASDDPAYEGEDFQRVAELFYRLQQRGAIQLEEAHGGGAYTLEFGDVPSMAALANELKERLGLDLARRSFPVLGGHPPGWDGQGADGYLVLRGRSLLGTLVYLSHGVEVFEGDTSARSLDFVGEDGEPVAVQRVSRPLLSVHVADSRPDGAYAATDYRGRWYAVDDNDLQSKQFLLLLRVLFSALSSEDL